MVADLNETRADADIPTVMTILRCLVAVFALFLSTPIAAAEDTTAPTWQGELDEGFIRSASDPLAVFFEVFPLGGDVTDIPALGEIEVEHNLVTFHLPAAGGEVEGTIEYASKTTYEAIDIGVGDGEGGFTWGPNTFDIAWAADVAASYQPGSDGEPGILTGTASGRLTLTCAGVCVDIESPDSTMELAFKARVVADRVSAEFDDTAPAAGFEAAPVSPPPEEAQEGEAMIAAEPTTEPTVTTVAEVGVAEDDAEVEPLEASPVPAEEGESFPVGETAVGGAVLVFLAILWYLYRATIGKGRLGYTDAVAVGQVMGDVYQFLDPDGGVVDSEARPVLDDGAATSAGSSQEI